VIQGGELKSKKGVNLIQKYHFQRWQKRQLMLFLPLNKSRLDTFFCKTPQDLNLQNLIAEHSDYKIPIIAKIEMPKH
jgi:pyruvate kinase